MSIKIVSDSSSNVFTLEGANYTTVPMKLIPVRRSSWILRSWIWPAWWTI